MSSMIYHKRSISGNQPSVNKINNLKSNAIISKNRTQKDSLTPSKNIQKNSNTSQEKMQTFKPAIISLKNPFLNSQKTPIQLLYDKNSFAKRKELTKEFSINLSENPNNMNNSSNNVYQKTDNTSKTKSTSAIPSIDKKIPLNKMNDKLKEKLSNCQIKLKRNGKKMDISNQSLSSESFTTGITEKTSRIADKSINMSSRRLNNSNVSKDNKINVTINKSTERVTYEEKVKKFNGNLSSRSPITLIANTHASNQRNISPSFFNGKKENTNKTESFAKEESKGKLNSSSRLTNNYVNLNSNREKKISPFRTTNNEQTKTAFREMNTSPLLRKTEFSKKLKERIRKSIPSLSNVKPNQVQSSVVNITEKFKKSIKSIQELTKTGFSGEGNPKKINQDNFFIYKNFLNNIYNNAIYFGVCDGHGAYGHEVSSFLKDNLPKSLDFEVKRRFKEKNLKKIIEEVFVSNNKKLINDTIINSNFSGSTCVSVIYTEHKLICANVGDSRAVLGRYVNDTWQSHNLSRDHKPSEKDESARIISRNGRIEAYRDEYDEFVGPQRVWLIDEDIPGLAMSRSFGDQVAASVGVICEPEWELTTEDKFMVIGSDGVFEFIESDQIVDIVKEYYLKNDILGCVEKLVEESSNRWMKEEQVIDDITVIVVFFD